MKLSDLKSPIAGYVLTLILTAFGAIGWLRAEIATQQQRAASQARDTDDMRARIASLELSARNCKP